QRHDTKKMYNGDLSMKLWDVPEYSLFNLENDISESDNVANKYPKILNHMKTKLQLIIDSGKSRK
ncbi:arylsulfatase, partial [Candidatus Marinimicrobia bacterium]|nr:arylsulfatase [Candidatus Neomarinimicrobiota bacterium]